MAMQSRRPRRWPSRAVSGAWRPPHAGGDRSRRRCAASVARPMRRWCWNTSSASRKPKTIMISTSACAKDCCSRSCRAKERARTGCSAAAQTLNMLRSRSPKHAEELFDWTSRFVRVARLAETEEERRWRHAACLFSDIGWRAHPDYRGEQTLEPDRQRQFRRGQSRGPRVPRARGLLPLCRPERAGRAAPRCAELIPQRMVELGANARHGDPRRASDLGSAARRAWRDAFRGRAARSCWCSSTGWSISSPIAFGSRFKQLARLLGRDRNNSAALNSTALTHCMAVFAGFTS